MMYYTYTIAGICGHMYSGRTYLGSPSFFIIYKFNIYFHFFWLDSDRYCTTLLHVCMYVVHVSCTVLVQSYCYVYYVYITVQYVCVHTYMYMSTYIHDEIHVRSTVYVVPLLPVVFFTYFTCARVYM